MFDWRIYWSVLAALLTFSFISAVTGAVTLAVWSHETQKRVEAVVEQGRRVMAHQQARRHAEQRRQQESRERELASRTLSTSQRCIGGTVVDIDGSSYTQRLQAGRPVTCRGRMADQPLR